MYTYDNNYSLNDIITLADHTNSVLIESQLLSMGFQIGSHGNPIKHIKLYTFNKIQIMGMSNIFISSDNIFSFLAVMVGRVLTGFS